MKTIRIRMLAILIPIIVVSLLASNGTLFLFAKDQITNQILVQNKNQTQLVSNETGLWLGRFFTLIDTTAQNDYHLPLDNDQRLKLMGNMMKIDPAVTDIYLGLENGVMLDGSGWVPPSDYDPRQRPWYGAAISAGKTEFSDPYMDMVTNKIVTSVSSPVKNPDGSLKGVLAADIQLTDVTNKINEIKVGESGYALIMTSSGTIIAHPDQTVIGKNGLTDLGDDIKRLTEAVISDKSGSYQYKYEGIAKISTYAEIPNTTWKIVLTMPMSELTKELNKLTYVIIISSGIFILIAIIAVLMITSRISKPIVQLNKITGKLAEGDLTQRATIKTQSEIGNLANSFNTMADNIGSLVGGITVLTKEVHEVSNQMNQSAEKTEDIAVQISHAVNELARGAEQQSDSVNSSVEKVNSMVGSINDINSSILSAYNLTGSVDQLVKQGEQAILLQNKSMQENSSATNNVNHAIQLLEERTKEISQIVDVIDGIASQTNLLALNASIEAARAGEQGKGFSVVADEIRKLAEQSSLSTSRIGESIKDIVLRTQSVVDQAQVAGNAVKEQESTVGQVVQIFQDVKVSIEEIKNSFDVVKSKTEGIKYEADSIRLSITDISNVIEMNAAGSQEVAASTEQQVNTLADVSRLSAELEQLASELQIAVEKFKL